MDLYLTKISDIVQAERLSLVPSDIKFGFIRVQSSELVNLKLVAPPILTRTVVVAHLVHLFIHDGFSHYDLTHLFLYLLLLQVHDVSP